MKKFLFKFPCRGRPEKFMSTLSKHVKSLSNKNEYKFIFSFDEDDTKMNNPEILNFLSELKINYEVNFDNNKNKIQAINANLENQIFDILVLIADDMLPNYENYDDIICNIFETSENGLDCVVHFNTARWSNTLDIWCVMGKEYYNRFGYIYHPDYKSIFCDNEYTEVSKILNKNIFSEICLFEHDHQTGDDTEVRNWHFNNEDWCVYENRKKNKFFLSVDHIINKEILNT